MTRAIALDLAPACRWRRSLPASRTITWSATPITSDMLCSTTITVVPLSRIGAQQGREFGGLGVVQARRRAHRAAPDAAAP